MEKNNIEVRSLQGTKAGEGRTVEGYAIVFGQESRVLCDWCDYFIETIDREAVSEELIQRSDVKCYFNHNRERLLARSVNGEGTLKLTLDETGLRYSFEAPDTADGNMVLELVKRGDITGSSFAFSVDGEDAVEYYRDADDMLHRTIKKISGLYDVSPVIDPAYTQTTCEARNWAPAEQPEEETRSEEPEEEQHSEPYQAQLLKERKKLHNNLIH